jgi:hypothetical protein
MVTMSLPMWRFLRSCLGLAGVAGRRGATWYITSHPWNLLYTLYSPVLSPVYRREGLVHAVLACAVACVQEGGISGEHSMS